MWTIKGRIACFLVITLFMGILFSPAQGHCVTLKGNLVKPGSTTAVGDVIVYLYDWELVKQQGGLYGPPWSPGPQITKTSSTSTGGINFSRDLKDWVSLNKEYLLVFSTQQIVTEGEAYASFFYGANDEADYGNPGKYTSQVKWHNILTQVPKIMFTSGTLNLGNFSPPTGTKEGFRLVGAVLNKNGNPFKDVGVEVYEDANGVPVLPPYPFYRYIKTGVYNDAKNSNFEIGGFLKNTTYYIRLIASHLGDRGYIDTFWKKPDSDEPREFRFVIPDSQIYQLNDEGAKISGSIKKQVDNTPVTNSIIVIQVISYTDDNQVKFMQNYVHDPNYSRYDDKSDVERHFFGYDRYGFSSIGKYELKGVPYEDHDYIVLAAESTENPFQADTSYKKYATPVFYDANDGAFNINQAKTISFGTAGISNVNFYLKQGACITGQIGFDEEMSDHVKEVLKFADQNFVDPIYIEAYLVDKKGAAPTLMAQHVELEGFAPDRSVVPFAVCGLLPGEYILKANDYPIIRQYPSEFFDDQLTYITAETITLPDYGSEEKIETEELDPNIWYLALGGILAGRVLDSNRVPISKASVFVNQINAGNPLVGYYFVNSEGTILAQYPSQTDPNGRFYVWGLPEGSYTVFVNGVLLDENTGYLPQFYDPNNSNKTMIANQAPPFFVENNNPDFKTLESFQLTRSGAETGGIISGKISLDPSISELVELSTTAFYMRLYKYDTGIELSNPLYRFEVPVSNGIQYSIMIPADGAYILSVQDTGGELLPHYYRDALQSTIDMDEADPLLVDQEHTPLIGIDFLLSQKVGAISGQALDDPNGNGISGLYVFAKQQVLEGPETGTWKTVNQAQTGSDGKFTLKGLYPGTYIFAISDPSFFRYPTRYYHPSLEVYTEEGAYLWDSSSGPSSIIFSLKKGGRITGKVNNAFIGTKIYAYLMKDEKQFAGYTTDADPNFTLPGLAPGEYMLGYKDPNLNYLPVYYTQSGFTTDPNQVNPSDITVGINESVSVGEMGFEQPGADVSGQIRTDTGSGLEPMTNTYIFLYRISGKREIWATTPAQFTSTDPNGNYSLKGLSKGNYEIIAFGPAYRPISRTLTIVDLDLGDVKQNVDLTFPSGWLNKKYYRTLELEKGLNLVAYPTRIPPYVTGYTSLSFLKDIVMVNGHGSMSLRTFSTSEQEWKSASFGSAVTEGTQITGVHGKNFYVSNGLGFMLYSGEGPTIDFHYFPGQTSLWLKKGINLVGNVAFDPDLADVSETDFISDTNFTTRKMLAQMGEDASISIQTFEAKAGKWQATYWMWGKPAGAETKVKDEQGYLVSMKKDLNNWYPNNNN